MDATPRIGEISPEIVTTIESNPQVIAYDLHEASQKLHDLRRAGLRRHQFGLAMPAERRNVSVDGNAQIAARTVSLSRKAYRPVP